MKKQMIKKKKEKEDLVYKVNELPQSLLHYTYSFGSITEEDEKKYINAIIKDLFNIDQEKKLYEKTTEAISKCHKFLKENFGEEKKDKNNKDITEPEPSVVSLREMNRFKSCVYFFKIII